MGGPKIPQESSDPAALDILKRVRDVRASTDDAKQLLSVSDYAGRKQIDDQSHIARMIIDLFRWCVAAVIGVFLVDFIARLNGLTTDNGAVMREIVDFVKVSILPLVTLVLGFYFGRLEQNKDKPK